MRPLPLRALTAALLLLATPAPAHGHRHGTFPRGRLRLHRDADKAPFRHEPIRSWEQPGAAPFFGWEQDGRPKVPRPPPRQPTR